jgi:hypothetical protein
MLHGGAHISTPRRQHRIEAYVPPPYHWSGFGRQSCKPSWFDGARDKKPLELWEGDACGAPRVVEKRVGKKAPYNHSDDDRMYRPTVPLDLKTLGTLVPAAKDNRQLISRGTMRKDLHDRYVEHGVTEKYNAYSAMSKESKEIYLFNKHKSVQTEMKEIIFAKQTGETSLPYSRTRSDFFK